MANELLELVSGASFKEVPFLLDAHSFTGGRKQVVHQFVNSDKQKVEDLGLKRRSYSMTAIITGTDDYINKRDALIAVLEEGGSGTLVHPFFGAVTDMVARPFTVSEDFREFGVARFNLKFDFNDPGTAAPIQDANTISEVQKAAESVRSATAESLGGSFIIPKLIGVYNSARGKLTKFIGIINKASKASDGIKSEINSFNNQLKAFSGSLVSLLAIPQELASDILDLYVTATNIFEAPRQALEAMLSMFDFGDDDKEQLTFPTETLNEINTNEDVLNTSINTFSLIQAYEYFVQTDFATVQDLEFFENIIEKQYQKVINSGVSRESNIANVEIEALSREAKAELTTLRTIVGQVIAEVKTTLPDVIDIKVNVRTPLRVIEYQYYGNNDQTDSIRSLNENPNESFIQGTLEIINNA